MAWLNFDWVSQPEAWVALVTLVILELVLGVDNVIFISILAGKLRDEWVYGDNKRELGQKVGFLIDVYNNEVERYTGEVDREAAVDGLERSIKWTRAVKQHLASGVRYSFHTELMVTVLYRPFIKRHLYFSSELNEMQYRQPEIFVGENRVIGFTDPGSQKPFMILASRNIPDLHPVGAACGTQCLPLYRYTAAGDRVDNITDWALDQFRKHYSGTPAGGVARRLSLTGKWRL